MYSERWISNSIRKSASHFDVVYSPNRNRVVYSGAVASSGAEDVFESPEEDFFARERVLVVRKIIDELPARESGIVKKIFGFDASPQALREVGPTYNLTHERVRQIKNSVISRLRENENLVAIY
jgi:DNA-directed RNA polymerase sigma subunit (sigma70/sigma32)